MIIRVPLLLQKTIAVIHRLNIRVTRNTDPDGEPDEGYDPTFREAIVYTDTTTLERTSARREYIPVRIPCQVEAMTEERLKEFAVGDDPIANFILVFHRKDLNELCLLDANQEVVIKKGDRLSHFEQYGAVEGKVTKRFADPGLYVHEMRGASWGFGPTGYDLELCSLTRRRTAPTA
jgi:hypothetical protein